MAATVEGGEQEGLSHGCIGWRDGVTGPEPLLPNYLWPQVLLWPGGQSCVCYSSVATGFARAAGSAIVAEDPG